MQVVAPLDCSRSNKALNLRKVAHHNCKWLLFAIVELCEDVLVLVICRNITVFRTRTNENLVFSEETSLIQIYQSYLVEFGHNSYAIFFNEVKVSFDLTLTDYYFTWTKLL